MIKKLTPKQFLTKRKKLNEELNKMIKQVDVLNNQYVRSHCDIKTGHVFDLPEGTKEGYQQFKVEKITPVINEAGKNLFNISFNYYGEFIGTDQPVLKGNLKFKAPPSPDMAKA